MTGTLFPLTTSGPRDGATFDPVRDGVRLNRQAWDVWRCMTMDTGGSKWWTLPGIDSVSFATWESRHSEAGISARLRDFRKAKFGAHTVDRRRRSDGLYEYRLTPRAGVEMRGPGRGE